MGFITALTEFATAVANLHPDHRARFGELAGVEHPPADAESPESASEPFREARLVVHHQQSHESIVSHAP